MVKYDFEDKETFMKDIRTMLQQGSSSDVKIKLSDGEIVASKDILSARSEYFSAMFRYQFLEEETSSVNMTHCTKDVMEVIINYLFSGVAMFRDLSLVQLVQLSHLTKLMLLSKFQHAVDDYMKDVISKDLNDLSILCLALKEANQFKLENMKNHMIKKMFYWLKENEWCQDDSFKFLPFNLIRDLFLFTPSQSEYEKPTTKQKFDSFLIWLSENDPSDDQKGEIVKSFHFNDFTVDELLNSVMESGLYTISKIHDRVSAMFKEQEELIKNMKKSIKIKSDTIEAMIIRGNDIVKNLSRN